MMAGRVQLRHVRAGHGIMRLHGELRRTLLQYYWRETVARNKRYKLVHQNFDELMGAL